MIVGAAFCPHPPLLIPAVAGGAAAELDSLRQACRTALRQVVSPGARPVVIGAGPAWRPHAANARGSLGPYGLELVVSLGSDAPGPVELPLPLTIGAWLLRDALGPGCGATGWSVGPDGAAGPDSLLAGDQPVALIVMGDGSARRSRTAPGYLDERAAGFDATVAAALAGGDPAALAAVDAGLAGELLAAGAPAWHAAASLLSGQRYDAQLTYDEAPYGVGYFVATWIAG